MQVDFLIVGQGICGTFLSYFLHKEQKSFVVIDNNNKNAASRVSAGIINPVTGRRMVKVWMAEEILPFASRAYSEIGHLLNLDAISQKNLIDFFPNPHQRQVFLERIEEKEIYLYPYPDQNDFNNYFNYELGSGEIRHCYTAHLDLLLPAWRNFLIAKQLLIEEEFELNDLNIGKEQVRYKNINASKIIFCDGLNSFSLPFFKQLPFAPNKGEALIVEIEELPAHHIYKKGFVLAPLSAANTFWMGSNYQWSFEHEQPTKEFYEHAERHLKAWLKLPYKVLDHIAAVRPATLERRPFVGTHPHLPSVAILNGMGTKGCSLAPYFAKQLCDHLINNTAIIAEASINRFTKILSKEIK
jgi:glycine/D-amino acid oxidase-like deaminating enzyme